MKLGAYELAEPLVRNAHVRFMERFGNANPQSFVTQSNLGFLLSQTGQQKESLELLEKACEFGPQSCPKTIG